MSAHYTLGALASHEEDHVVDACRRAGVGDVVADRRREPRLPAGHRCGVLPAYLEAAGFTVEHTGPTSSTIRRRKVS
jgi:hypothetical protein